MAETMGSRDTRIQKVVSKLTKVALKTTAQILILNGRLQKELAFIISAAGSADLNEADVSEIKQVKVELQKASNILDDIEMDLERFDDNVVGGNDPNPGMESIKRTSEHKTPAPKGFTLSLQHMMEG